MHRHRNPQPAQPRTDRDRTPHPATLTETERARVLAHLHADRFADKAPEQIWATLLDEGTYLCSVSTMYRLLRENDQVRERRSQARHPPRARPELTAHGRPRAPISTCS